MHEVEFINEAVPLEQPQRAIDSTPVNASIELLRFAQNLAGIKVLIGGLNDAQDGAALFGHADTALGEVGLQAARHFGLRKRHSTSPSLVATGRN